MWTYKELSYVKSKSSKNISNKVCHAKDASLGLLHKIPLDFKHQVYHTKHVSFGQLHKIPLYFKHPNLIQTINQLRICAITTLVFLTTLLSDLLWWPHPPSLKAFKEDRSAIHFYFFCHVLRKSYNMVSSHGKDWMSMIKRTLQNKISITNKSICLNSGNNKTPWY